MEKLSLEKAREMLLAKDVDISLEQAKLVLEFMRNGQYRSGGLSRKSPEILI